MLYAPIEGRCRIDIAADEPIELETGDIAILVQPGPHVVRSHAAAPAVPLDVLLQGACDGPGQLVRHGGGGPATQLVVGWIDFAASDRNRLLAGIPPVLRLPRDGIDDLDGQPAMLSTLVRSSTQDVPGGQAISRRLTEMLFIVALRRYVRDSGQSQTGWLAALRDPRLARLLAAIHRDPARSWTLAEFATIACLSRTALFDLFKSRIGSTPHDYLTEVRMRAAERILRSGGLSVEAVSHTVGYGSAASFSRAYRRTTGRSPRDVRARTDAS